MARKQRETVHEYKAAGRYDVEIRPGESDMEYYRRLAKAADQRLVRLEKLAEEPGFSGVKKYAYARAMRDIESYGGEGEKLRFNTKPPEVRQLFNEKIMDMRAFLSSPTSTKAGIIDVYKKRVETINKKYGTNYTWQQLADFFDSGDADRLFKDYGSKTVMMAIGKIQKTQEQIKAGIEENKNRRRDTPADELARKIMSRPSLSTLDLRLNMTQEEKKKVKAALQ